MKQIIWITLIAIGMSGCAGNIRLDKIYEDQLIIRALFTTAERQSHDWWMDVSAWMVKGERV